MVPVHDEFDLQVDLGAPRSRVLAEARRWRNRSNSSMAAAMLRSRRACWRSVSSVLQTHTMDQASMEGSGARWTYQQSRGPSL